VSQDDLPTGEVVMHRSMTRTRVHLTFSVPMIPRAIVAHVRSYMV